jgi:hypothetical protein
LSGDSAAEILPAGLYILTDGRKTTDVARMIRRVELMAVAYQPRYRAGVCGTGV